MKCDPADGLYKVSTRSKGAVDVGAVCTALGGGGTASPPASPRTTTPPTTLAAVRAALERAPHLPV